MTWGMMLARLAFMSRPYKDGWGLLVTRSKMPTRSLRMQILQQGKQSSARLVTQGRWPITASGKCGRAGRTNGGGADTKGRRVDGGRQPVCRGSSSHVSCPNMARQDAPRVTRREPGAPPAGSDTRAERVENRHLSLEG